jgi:hypothetical protein
LLILDLPGSQTVSESEGLAKVGGGIIGIHEPVSHSLWSFTAAALDESESEEMAYRQIIIFV